MTDAPDTTTIVSVLLSSGGALVLRELIAGAFKIRRGIAATEGKRNSDLVAARVEAEARAKAAYAEFEAERKLRLAEQLYAADLERRLTVNGISLPERP